MSVFTFLAEHQGTRYFDGPVGVYVQKTENMYIYIHPEKVPREIRLAVMLNAREREGRVYGDGARLSRMVILKANEEYNGLPVFVTIRHR